MTSGQQTVPHPALSAWARLRPGGGEADTVEVLHDTKKTGVFRLRRAGADGSSIIAKRCRRETAEVERRVYTEVLPQLPLPTLTCYGLVVDEEEAFAWLLLEDAGGIAFDPDNKQHCALAADWLAALHSVVVPDDVARRLPGRPAGWYREELQATHQRLGAGLANPALTADDRTILRRLLRQCVTLLAMWPRIEVLCAGMPAGLVHGDFVPKNLRVRLEAERPVLQVFDWEVAGWGVPAADVAQCPDLPRYVRAIRATAPHQTTEEVQRLADCGRLFRLIAGISWSSWHLAYPWMDKGMRRLRCYETELPRQLQTWARGA